MVKEFDSKHWAVILGGSSGLGLASAKKLARHGMNICVVYRSSRSGLDVIKSQLDNISSFGVEVLDFNADASKTEAIQKITTTILSKIGTGKVRCLLHSIAKGNLKPLNELTADDFQLTLNAMAISLISWSNAFAELKLFAPSSRIIAFTGEGSSKAIPNYTAVSAAKAALESIIRSIAVEYSPMGITANCIQAGVTETDSLKMIPGYQQILKHSQQRNPMNRLTTPSDVADVVYLLCKDEAAWINGTVITADGGESLR